MSSRPQPAATLAGGFLVIVATACSSDPAATDAAASVATTDSSGGTHTSSTETATSTATVPTTTTSETLTATTLGVTSATLTGSTTSAVTEGVGGTGSTSTGPQNGTSATSANSTGAGGTATGGGAGAAGSASGATTVGMAPSNCTTSTLTNGDQNRTVSVGGMSRSFILHVPSSYDGSTPTALVLDFHALGGSGSQESSGSGYRAVSDQEGFLVAFPDGIDNAWDIGPCCTNSPVDDLGFARGMIDSIAADGCVDRTRVYATGISNGGGMSYHLACQAADVIAAVVPAAFDLLDPEEPPCTPTRPISVLSFRGDADPVVPFEGGRGSGNRVTFQGAEQTLERWAEINHCTPPATVDGDCSLYEQCDAGVQVGLCVQRGGGHGGGDANLGWNFMNQFTLP